MNINNNIRPLITAGFILGVGIGGFFDGIMFHQILQSHNMLSNIIFPNTVVNIEINMFWDGMFDAFNYIMILIGLTLLWKVVKREDVPKLTHVFLGSIISGFGTFNLVEGIIDHHILKLHHVIQRASSPYQLYWDLAFLASGIILIIVGIFITKLKLPKSVKI